MPVVVVERGSLRGKRFALPERGTVRIGRDADCQIQCQDYLISRHHCLLKGEKERWQIEDQESSNGTFLNGARITTRRLQPGDLIQIGTTRLSFFESSDDRLLGHTLGGCRLETRVGRGGMGTVYRAQQLSLNRKVAVKVLAPSVAHDAAFVEHFVREARAAARLGHPNIIPVFDVGNDGSEYYIIMEYVPGGTLEQLILREGPLPHRTVVAVGLDVLKALAFAEVNGIVHRDIKPANILFAADGVAKIGDLGIAVDLTRPEPLRAATVAGSPNYMAPEQARSADVDIRADIYGLGATLYHALTGVPPFKAGSVKEVLRKKLRGDTPRLSEHVPGIPSRLASAIGTMMAHRASDRYDSAEEAAEALEGAGRARRPPRRAPVPFRRRRSASSLAVAAVVGVFILLAGIYGLRALNRNDTPPDPSPIATLAPKEGVTSEEKPLTPLRQPTPRPRAVKPMPAEPKPETKVEDERAQQATARLDTLIRTERFREAAALLETMPFTVRYSSGIQEREKTLETRIAERIRDRAGRIESLCQARKFAEARRLLSDLEALLPATHATKLRALKRGIEKGELAARTTEPNPLPPGESETGVTPPGETPPALTPEALEAYIASVWTQQPIPVQTEEPVSGFVRILPDPLAFETARTALQKLRTEATTKELTEHLKQFIRTNRKKLEAKPILEITLDAGKGYGLFIPKGDQRNNFVITIGRSKATRTIAKRSRDPRYATWMVYIGSPYRSSKKPASLWLLEEPLTVTMALGIRWKTKPLTVQVKGLWLSKKRKYAPTGTRPPRSPRTPPRPPPRRPFLAAGAPQFEWEAYDPNMMRIGCTRTQNLAFKPGPVTFSSRDRLKGTELLPALLKQLLEE